MDRPKEAIERIRSELNASVNRCQSLTLYSAHMALLAYLDWLEGKHVVDWPKELTRERLNWLADPFNDRPLSMIEEALRALAAIAPQRKKRVVNLWVNDNTHASCWPSVFSADYDPNEATNRTSWRCVARNIELEE